MSILAGFDPANKMSGQSDPGKINQGHSARLHEYLLSLEAEKAPFLKALRIYGREHFVPLVLEETESLLKTVVTITVPRTILEIGTGIGYSAIVMACAAPNAAITTIENFDKRLPIIRENLRKAGVEDRVELIYADASLALKDLATAKKTYDLIFLDAAKGQYLRWLPDIMDLTVPGSVIFTDNVLLNDSVMESKYLLPHRARSTHERMREFLYQLKHDERLISSVIPVGDGVALSVRV